MYKENSLPLRNVFLENLIPWKGKEGERRRINQEQGVSPNLLAVILLEKKECVYLPPLHLPFLRKVEDTRLHAHDLE